MCVRSTKGFAPGIERFFATDVKKIFLFGEEQKRTIRFATRGLFLPPPRVKKMPPTLWLESKVLHVHFLTCEYKKIITLSINTKKRFFALISLCIFLHYRAVAKSIYFYAMHWHAVEIKKILRKSITRHSRDFFFFRIIPFAGVISSKSSFLSHNQHIFQSRKLFILRVAVLIWRFCILWGFIFYFSGYWCKIIKINLYNLKYFIIKGLYTDKNCFIQFYLYIIPPTHSILCLGVHDSWS